MQTIVIRDEKLYTITAGDYGDGFHRTVGILVHSVVKGVGIAGLIGVFILFPRVSFKEWIALLSPVALICSVWVAFTDRRSYICQIEIFPDRIIRHSGEKTLGIGRGEVRSMKEGSCWTMFGWVDGLAVRGKTASIFIPSACPDFAEIKSRLGGWHSISP